jgi:hypothetical protein
MTVYAAAIFVVVVFVVVDSSSSCNANDDPTKRINLSSGANGVLMIMLGSTCTIAIESDARMGNRTVCSNITLPTAPSNSPPTTRHGRRAMGRMFFGSQFDASVRGGTYLFLDQI